MPRAETVRLPEPVLDRHITLENSMSFRLMTLVPVAALALAACGDSTGAGNTGLRLNLSSKTRTLASPAALTADSGMALLAAPVTFTGGGNTLVLDQVQLVLKQIELKTLSSDSCSGTSSDSCDDIQLGIRLYDVPLGAATAQGVYTVAVDPGTYRQIKFKIAKPGSSDDAAFIAANPNFNGVSIRATGTWNGQPFTFTSEMDDEVEIEFPTPLVVGAEGTTDVTLNLDVSRWFRSLGGALIDPRTANKGQPNEGVVKENIKNTIEGFEDDDRDGETD